MIRKALKTERQPAFSIEARRDRFHKAGTKPQQQASGQSVLLDLPNAVHGEESAQSAFNFALELYRQNNFENHSTMVQSVIAIIHKTLGINSELAKNMIKKIYENEAYETLQSPIAQEFPRITNDLLKEEEHNTKGAPPAEITL